jgi:hypothetical protein
MAEMGSYLSKNRDKMLVWMNDSADGTVEGFQEWMAQVA